MNPLFWIIDKSSLKKELMVVGSIVLTLLFLPMGILLSVTNVSALTAYALFDQPTNPKDAYEYGNCTYWSALQRINAGNPIPNTWGNANTWAERAKAMNYLVDHIPTVGSIMQTSAGELGHVAYVTAVDPFTGSWTISEMNVVGWDMVDNKTLPASADKNFFFIHDQVIIPGLKLPTNPALKVTP